MPEQVAQQWLCGLPPGPKRAGNAPSISRAGRSLLPVIKHSASRETYRIRPMAIADKLGYFRSDRSLSGHVGDKCSIEDE